MLDFSNDFVQRTIIERERKSLLTLFNFFCVWEIGNLHSKSATNRIKCVNTNRVSPTFEKEQFFKVIFID